MKVKRYTKKRIRVKLCQINMTPDTTNIISLLSHTEYYIFVLYLQQKHRQGIFHRASLRYWLFHKRR